VLYRLPARGRKAACARSLARETYTGPLVVGEDL
jgi:hypothetical protein